MGALRELRRFTFEEYLLIEEQAFEKSEFLDGIIYRLPGGSFHHVVIKDNISYGLNLKLTDSGCLAVSSDLLVSNERRSFSYYPDVLVVCGKPLFFKNKSNVLLNPKSIFEVLSPSTESDDRGPKFRGYLTIPSLEDFFLVAQDRPHVEHWHRTPEGWRGSIVEGEGSLKLESLNLDLSLAMIYRNIDFEGDGD